MSLQIKNCPICNQKNLGTHLTCEDHTVSHENFTILYCDHCGFLFTSPRPEEKDLGDYYLSEEYISHTNKGNNLINVIYKIARTFTLKSKRKLLGKPTKTKKLLDYGCGTGDFLATCQKSGWKTTGIEPDPKARKIAESHNGQKVYPEIKNLEEDEKYDIITLWHVLEHVTRLDEIFSHLMKILQPGGKMIIAVPNPNSHDAQHYQEYWAAYDVPRHLYHFTQKTMNDFVQKKGAKLIKTLPMKLDAYYVSLLSEKYKNKNKSPLSNYTKALKVGYISNKKASKNREYSSLIYIIKK